MTYCLEPGVWERREEDDDPTGEPTETLVVRECLDGACHQTERETDAGARRLGLTFTDPSTDEWAETRATDDGELVEIRGQFDDGRIRATGRRVTSSGTAQRYRQTLTVEDDGSVAVVEEAAEANTDEDWSISGRARYVRVDDAPSSPEPTAEPLETATAGTGSTTTGTATLDSRRQFDFWVGEWDVSTVDGNPAGRNVIESVLDGYLLVEHWESAGGGAGLSLNCYDAAADEWLQTWVDSTGGCIETRGTFRDGAMRQSGVLVNGDGTRQDYRGTWTPEADGTVTQLLETSDDGGEAFDEWFHGTYVRSTE
ncbi:hypothetical protein [Haloarchaeobius sp. DFWS5]|uniref:hypothetical protein n=1 Tax=Haloarchaeobius sp. DFWS5 TaxID=3446114 RepID=UPI003EB6CB68